MSGAARRRGPARIRRLLAPCALLAAMLPGAVTAQSALQPADREALARELACPQEFLDSLRASHLQAPSQTLAAPTPPGAALCELAVDALCASTPQAAACRQRAVSGAYAGYYLSRHAMPLVVWLRAALEGDQDTTATAAQGLESLTLLLDLLDPGLQGCTGARFLRTWCTRSGERDALVASHRYTTGYFASEALRLLAQCWAQQDRCPLQDVSRLSARIALWFDLLLWDHVYFDATGVRNSFTRTLPRGNQIGARLNAHAAHQAGEGPDSGPFLFHVEGYAVAIAANLLASDRLLAGASDPRPGPLSSSGRATLQDLVTRGAAVLGGRLEATRVSDFHGEEQAGAQYDGLRWDRHAYRRFSGATAAERPFEVRLDNDGKVTGVQMTSADPGPHRGAGLDSGHTRRLVWLHYTLWQTGAMLEQEWVDESALQGLAAQFAYAVYRHPCRDGRCEAPAPGAPRFSNYFSGHDGWYRLTLEDPCTPAVPPSGFSTQMLLSEFLWWARFNPDIAEVWQQMARAAADPDAPAPSPGDLAPCGARAGEREWHWRYHDLLHGQVPGRSPYYRLSFLAMQRWAELGLPASD
jgi:hypothetical protein